MIISEERVRARRAALVAQMAEAQQQYAQLEQTLAAARPQSRRDAGRAARA
jgi:hypothetical protein